MNLRANSLAVSLGGIIRLVVNLVSIPLLVRLLGIDSYGVWTTINAQIGLLTLSEMGVSTALLYRLSGYLTQKEEQSFYQCIGTALFLVTVFGVVFSLIYFLLVPVIVKTFQVTTVGDGLIIALKVSALVILPKIWGLFFSSIEAAHQRYDVQAIIETATTLLLQAGIILFAWQKASLALLLVWSLFSGLLCVLAHSFVVSRLLKVKLKRILFVKSEAKGLLNFGIQHWVSSLGSSLFGQMDRILVNGFLGPAVCGIYSAATSITMKINELSAIPIKVITPAVSAEKAKNNYAQIRGIYFKATKLNGCAVLLVALPLIFWADFVGKVIVDGESARTFSSILPLLACIYGIYSLGASGFYLMLGLGKPRINAIWGIIGGLAMCATMVPLASTVGIMGAVWANAAYIAVIVINFRGSNLLGVHMGDYSQTFFRSVLILIGWTVIMYLLPVSELVVGIRIAVFFAAGALSLFFTLGWSELKLLFNQCKGKVFNQ